MPPTPDALALLTRLAELVFGVDGAGCVQLVAGTDLDALDRPPDQLQGIDLGELVAAPDRPTWHELLAKAAAAPDAEARGEVRLLTRSGGPRPVELRLVNRLDDPAVGLVVVTGSDRTEAHTAEASERRSQHLLEALARASTDVLMMIDSSSTIVWVSPTIEQAFGYREHEVVGRPGMEWVHPDDLAAAWDRLAWLLEEPGRAQTTDWRIRHADGSWRWVEALNINLLDDPDAGVIVASFRDITDRRRTEIALAESEARFRAVVQNSRDVTSLLDVSGRIVWASPNAREMLGVDPEEVAGTDALALVHPDDLALAAGTLAEIVAGPMQVNPIVIRLARGRDVWVPVEAAGSALRNADGVVEGVIVNLRDVAWRIEAETALRESEQRFRALVQNSSDVVIVVGGDSNIRYVSPAVERVFGRTPEELEGRPGRSLSHPDDLPLVEQGVGSVMDRPGGATTLGYRVVDARGQWRHVEATVTNLLDDPGVGGLVFNIRDVTDRVEAERAQRESQAMFRSVAEASPLGLYTTDDQGRCLWVNDRWQQITGLTAEQAAGHGWVRMVHPDDLEWLLADVGASAFTEHFELTYRVLHPDGSTRWVTVQTSPIPTEEGATPTSVGVMEDITDRIEAARDSQRLTDIFEATQDLIGIAASGGEILYLNRAARRFFGLPMVGPVADLDLSSVFTPWSVETLVNEVTSRLRRDAVWNGELSVLSGDGREVPVSAQLLVHHDAEGQLEFYSAVLRDISERKAFEHQLAHQATHDPLTGLPNRVLLIDQLAGALHRARRHDTAVAVLFLDLDHFKVVNDSLGHGLGDRLLVATAERLRTALRPGDTIARFGGDEFVLLCEDLAGPDDAVAIARRVEQALATPFSLDDSEIYVGVSVGIAFADRHADEPETLIRDADAAMYRAKEKGRARYEIFDSAMRASAVDRLDIENALRRSVDRRELRVHYQPLVDLRSGGVCGVEALLRWEHPERGLLLPADFITIAEETGLIVPIGGWVLAQACRQIQRWEAEHPATGDLVVTVNLSGRQLGHPRLVQEVEAVLAETGIDPQRVDLEITESVLMDDVELSTQTLRRLKDLGVRLVVDDFGTGYSSLSYLRQFPVDGLKVDRSFVDGLGEDAGDSAIVAAIVTLAHTLGLQAIAEGVETPAQLEALRHLDCDLAQGFHIARPLAAEALLEFVGGRPRF